MYSFLYNIAILMFVKWLRLQALLKKADFLKKKTKPEPDSIRFGASQSPANKPSLYLCWNAMDHPRFHLRCTWIGWNYKI